MLKNSIYLLVLLFCAACQAQEASAPSFWNGKWTGPEGTSLTITPLAEGSYQVNIQTLDGPTAFIGKWQDDAIRFEREGKVEHIRHGNGQDTGMKWLLDKQNCLFIQSGEGFCRD